MIEAGHRLVRQCRHQNYSISPGHQSWQGIENAIRIPEAVALGHRVSLPSRLDPVCESPEVCGSQGEFHKPVGPTALTETIAIGKKHRPFRDPDHLSNYRFGVGHMMEGPEFTDGIEGAVLERQCLTSTERNDS